MLLNLNYLEKIIKSLYHITNQGNSLEFHENLLYGHILD